MRFGGVPTLGAAKALKPIDSNAGKVINAEVLRRIWRRVGMVGSVFAGRRMGAEE
jgi:hypothetical protein